VVDDRHRDTAEYHAPNTTGACTIQLTPMIAITANQITMTGPKSRPTRCVPYCWMKKSAIRIVTAIGTTYGEKSGVITRSPSVALRIEIPDEGGGTRSHRPEQRFNRVEDARDAAECERCRAEPDNLSIIRRRVAPDDVHRIGRRVDVIERPVEIVEPRRQPVEPARDYLVKTGRDLVEARREAVKPIHDRLITASNKLLQPPRQPLHLTRKLSPTIPRHAALDAAGRATELTVVADVALGGLKPEEVEVRLASGLLDGDGVLTARALGISFGD